MNIDLTPIQRRLVWLLFLVYLAVLVKFILLKRFSDLMFVNMSLPHIRFRLQHYANFTPFKTIGYYMSGHANTIISVENIAGNVLLFSPLGFFVPLLRPRLTRVGQIGALAFGTSLLLELVQLLTGLGGFDVDDLILNVLGGLLGWLALTVIQRSGLLARMGLTQTSQRGSV